MRFPHIVRPNGSEYVAVLRKDILTDNTPCITTEYPDLPGCISWGQTVEEALSNLKDAKDLWLSVYLEAGENSSKPQAFFTSLFYPDTNAKQLGDPGVTEKEWVPFSDVTLEEMVRVISGKRIEAQHMSSGAKWWLNKQLNEALQSFLHSSKHTDRDELLVMDNEGKVNPVLSECLLKTVYAESERSVMLFIKCVIDDVHNEVSRYTSLEIRDYELMEEDEALLFLKK